MAENNIQRSRILILKAGMKAAQPPKVTLQQQSNEQLEQTDRSNNQDNSAER